MLTEVQRQLWEAYEAAEGRAPRTEKLQALDSFLTSLEESPPADWFPWARSIAEQVVDHGLNLVVRRPLFERAVFPALLAGYQTRLPGCARWLAGFASHLVSSPGCRARLPDEEATELGLLWAAIRHDPTDRGSRLRLIDRIVGRLRYSIHEVPSGVLYGMDGALPEQCVELEKELDHFCELVSQEGVQEHHAVLIRACRLHFRAYRDYLLDPRSFRSYAAYLADRAARLDC